MAEQSVPGTMSQLVPPPDLPPCWWIEVRYPNGNVEWRDARESPNQLDERLAYYRGQGWFRDAEIVHVVPEQPEFRCSRFCETIWVDREKNRAEITARWNWLHRNRDLFNSIPTKPCRVLPSLGEAQIETPLDGLTNRLGGRALLPRGTPWPKIGYHNGSYLGTYDLRGMFDFGPGFPDGISIFVEMDSDYYCGTNTGIVIPLFAGQQLDLVSPPKGVIAFPEQIVEPWLCPDFQDYEKNESLYDEIETREPETSGWINLWGRKIGGYPHFQQNNLCEELARRIPTMKWHWIGSFEGLFMFGDAGTLYILLGHNPKKNHWRWHVEWQGG